MIPKSLIAMALIMLAAGASAIQWRPCGNSSQEQIKNITINRCYSMSDGPCLLLSGRVIEFYVDYIQPKPIMHPVVRMEFEDGYYEEFTPLETGLSIPGSTGREQHFSSILRTPDWGRAPDLLMRLSVRGSDAPIEDTQFCLELPTSIREPFPAEFVPVEAKDSFQ